jgi:hypothetical protein
MTLTARAMSIKTGNPIRKLVLIKLADNANDNGECWPSYQHIADHCECSRSAVREHIEALIEMGLLKKLNRPGVKNGKGNASNVYTLNLDNPVPPKSIAPVPSENTGMPPESTPLCQQVAPESVTLLNQPLIHKIPLTPRGGDAEILADAQKALEYYNAKTDTRCRDVKPFVVLLTPTTTRAAYTLDDMRLVIRWVLATWNRRGAGLPKPANICRVNRFDGYIADAEKWAITEANIDPEAVMDGFNQIFAGLMPLAELDADRRRSIIRLAAHMKNQTTGAFLGYFENSVKPLLIFISVVNTTTAGAQALTT